MATFPYVLTLKTVLASGGTGTVTYSVPNNEELEIEQIRHSATGTFDITSIRDSSGLQYTNASQATGIPSAVLQGGGSPNIGIGDLGSPLVIKGGTQLIIDLLDTSGGSNTVKLVFTGKRTTGA